MTSLNFWNRRWLWSRYSDSIDASRLQLRYRRHPNSIPCRERRCPSSQLCTSHDEIHCEELACVRFLEKHIWGLRKNTYPITRFGNLCCDTRKMKHTAGQQKCFFLNGNNKMIALWPQNKRKNCMWLRINGMVYWWLNSTTSQITSPVHKEMVFKMLQIVVFRLSNDDYWFCSSLENNNNWNVNENI